MIDKLMVVFKYSKIEKHPPSIKIQPMRKDNLRWNGLCDYMDSAGLSRTSAGYPDFVEIKL